MIFPYAPLLLFLTGFWCVPLRLGILDPSCTLNHAELLLFFIFLSDCNIKKLWNWRVRIWAVVAARTSAPGWCKRSIKRMELIKNINIYTFAVHRVSAQRWALHPHCCPLSLRYSGSGRRLWFREKTLVQREDSSSGRRLWFRENTQVQGEDSDSERRL